MTNGTKGPRQHTEVKLAGSLSLREAEGSVPTPDTERNGGSVKRSTSSCRDTASLMTGRSGCRSPRRGQVFRPLQLSRVGHPQVSVDQGDVMRYHWGRVEP